LGLEERQRGAGFFKYARGRAGAGDRGEKKESEGEERKGGGGEEAGQVRERRGGRKRGEPENDRK
jgi:hypothetical protein